MTNKVQFDESGIEADEIARVAAVLAALIRAGEITRVAAVLATLVQAGALGWSSAAGTPVTGRRDKLTAEVEAWIRHG
jgi:hypothetical protein